MSACSKVALIGKHIILIHFFDFPGRRKPPPRHASTPFCGVAMLTIEFDQLEVPCSERGRTHITFHCLSLRHSWTVKPDIQQVELILVVFFVGGCPCNVSSVTTTASFGPTMWGLTVTGGSSFERAWVEGSKSYCVELDIVSMASLIVYLWIAGSVIKTNKDMFPQPLELPSGLGIFRAGTKLFFSAVPAGDAGQLAGSKRPSWRSSSGWSFGLSRWRKNRRIWCSAVLCCEDCWGWDS